MLGSWKREVPVVLSLVLPGLGQLYNRDWLKGLLLVLVTMWMSGRVGAEIDLLHPERMSVVRLSVGLVGLVTVLVYAIADARRVAALRVAA